MWQIRGDSSNELRPHVQVNGTYSQLKAVRLPMTIGLNTKHHARINVVGSTIRTYIDDVLVDTTVDTRNPNGSIGFRHGNTESARFDNVKVTCTTACSTRNDFSAAEHRLQPAARSRAASSSSAPRATAHTASPTTGRSCARASASPTSRSRGPRPTSPPAPPSPPASTSSSSASTARSSASARRARSTTRRRRCTTRTTSRRCSSAGDNALGALAYTTADKKFIAQLVIAYADGTREVVELRHVVEGARGRGRAPAGRQHRHELLRRAGREHRRAQVPERVRHRRVRRLRLVRGDGQDRHPGPHRHARRERRAAPARARLRRQDRRQAVLRRLRPHGRRRGAAQAQRRGRRGGRDPGGGGADEPERRRLHDAHRQHLPRRLDAAARHRRPSTCGATACSATPR